MQLLQAQNDPRQYKPNILLQILLEKLDILFLADPLRKIIEMQIVFEVKEEKHTILVLEVIQTSHNERIFYVFCQQIFYSQTSLLPDGDKFIFDDLFDDTLEFHSVIVYQSTVKVFADFFRCQLVVSIESAVVTRCSAIGILTQITDHQRVFLQKHLLSIKTS
jgi:hypothetical protein